MPPHVRAFLSHASVDKEYVRQVHHFVGEAFCEIDERSFEQGYFNEQAIKRALERSSLFVLFASEHSLNSDWVEAEIHQAVYLQKRHIIKRMLIFCLHPIDISAFRPELRAINIVRKPKSPGVCARQIRGALCELDAETATDDPHFVARDRELEALKRKILNPERDCLSCISISGIDGIGRSQILKRALRDVFPSFTRSGASTTVRREHSIDDIFRSLVNLQFGPGRTNASLDKIAEFSRISEEKQLSMIASEIHSIFDQGELVIFHDHGGILSDDGDLNETFQKIYSTIRESRDPRIGFVLYRNVPIRFQRKYHSILFYSVLPLDYDQAKVYTWYLARNSGYKFSDEVIDTIVRMSDGHPTNINYLVGYFGFAGSERNPHLPSDEFNIWKRNRSAEYLSKMTFSHRETILLSSLVLYRTLPSEFIGEILSVYADGSYPNDNPIHELFDKHVIESHGGQFSISRPLRDAIERDPQFRLSPTQRMQLAKTILTIISDYKDEEQMPVQLVDAGLVAILQDGKTDDSYIASLLLPSHYIWVCRQAYYMREYERAHEHSKSALDSRSNLSLVARLEALRFFALSSIRLSRRDDLQRALDELKGIGGSRPRGVYHFVRGFDFRLKGKFEEAERELRSAHQFMKSSIDTMRELIYVLNMREKFTEAYSIGRQLYEINNTNPFIIDSLVQTKIGLANTPDELDYDPEFISLMNDLEIYGNKQGLSFFALRSADIHMKKREFHKALAFAEDAVRLTPDLLVVYAVKSRILTSLRNYSAASANIKTMQNKMESDKNVKRNRELANLSIFRARIALNLSRGNFDLCIKDVENIRYYDIRMYENLKRSISFDISSSKKPLPRHVLLWAKS